VIQVILKTSNCDISIAWKVQPAYFKVNRLAKRKELKLPPRPRILLVRFSALGDVVQTLPILPMLRERYPDAHIGWAIDAELVPAIEGHQMLDRIHPCHRKRWIKAVKNPALWNSTLGEMRAFVDDVRSVNYDVALDLQGLLKTALLTRFSGAARRIGFAHGREFSNFFYDEAYINRKDYFAHHVLHIDHMAYLASVIGCEQGEHKLPLPPPTESTREKIDALMADNFSATDAILAVAPGTQWQSKKWPDHHWIALVRRVLKETSLKILFVGSPADAQLAAHIVSAVAADTPPGRIVNVAGTTKIQELYYLFTKVQAAIASDTAPLHIAGAAAVPHLFGLFGPTASKRTAPIGSADIQIFTTEGSLRCQPCHKRSCPLKTGECLESVYPDEVFNALVQAIPQVSTLLTAR
jgi:lipopolysaccharide heptosyltransferase I